MLMRAKVLASGSVILNCDHITFITSFKFFFILEWIMQLIPAVIK